MIVIFALIFLVLFALIEGLQRFVFKKTKWTRKTAHITMGIIIFTMPLYLTKIEIIILATVFVIALAASKYKQILSLHDVQRKTIGEILYPFSILVLAIITLPNNIEAFQAGALSLAFADGMAAIVGTRMPIKKIYILKNTKSLAGSLTFAIIIGLIIFLFPSMKDTNVLIKLVAVVVITLAEFFLVFGLDNLFVPVLTAILFMVV